MSKEDNKKAVKPDEISIEPRMDKRSKGAGNPNWKKGVSPNPNGRPKGSKDKVSMQVQEAFAFLVANNLGKFQSWIDRVAETRPDKALELMLKISEYVIPKKNIADAITRASEDGVQPITIVFNNPDKKIDEPDTTES